MRKLLLAALISGASVLPAYAQSCGNLWYERNAIYKDAGYCFNTPRGIRAFGNAGCQYDNVNDVPLSANSRARIAEIVRMERAYGCR
ncbi:MAG TPA: YARHG domain-containing protein [Rhodoblastus sp.]|nr:YARHG domain-containing protein [Rhodoblastus sp.]